MLFGERLQLAAILRDEERDDIERTRDMIECLHGVRPPKFIARLLIPYAVQVATSIINWLQREKNECSVPLLPDAQTAGAEQFAKNVGELGSIVQLADRFHCSFKQVYEMPYTEVFALWKFDAERAKFDRRLEKVIQSKIKTHK